MSNLMRPLLGFLTESAKKTKSEFVSWSMLIALCLLSVTGCTTTSSVCKPPSMPPLPKNVAEEAKTSSDFRTELMTLQRDVQLSLERNSKP